MSTSPWHGVWRLLLQSIFRRSRHRHRADFNPQLRKGKLGHTDCRPGRIVAWKVLILHFCELLHLSTQIDMKSCQLDNVVQSRAGCCQRSLQTLEREACLRSHSAGGSEFVVNADLSRDPDHIADSIRLRKMKSVIQRLGCRGIYEYSFHKKNLSCQVSL